MISVGIIEDELQFRNALEYILKITPDISVTGIWADAETAIRQIPRLLPDVVLVDIGLPGISGIECIAKLKKTNPAVCFIILTMFEDDEHVFEALKAGASGYLLKGDGPEFILQGIREIMNGGAPMSWKIARKVIDFFHHAAVKNNNTVLTLREKEVLTLLSKGKMYKEVASELSITLATTKKHINNIYFKLEVQNRTEAINKWRFI